jgi:DNA-binding PadR family transcriptional regulator
MSARSATSSLGLTEHEGMLLALVHREQPITAYQLFKIFEGSPVSSINTSKGQIYPAIRRLKNRKLLRAKRVTGDARGTEELTLTKNGEAAVRAWVLKLDDSHVVLDDPLRTRVLSFDVLSRQEQLEWVAKAKSLVWTRRKILDEYDRSVEMPYQDFAYHSVAETLRVKMEWLDELLYHLANPEPDERSS